MHTPALIKIINTTTNTANTNTMIHYSVRLKTEAFLSILDPRFCNLDREGLSLITESLVKFDDKTANKPVIKREKRKKRQKISKVVCNQIPVSTGIKHIIIIHGIK
jgi:hypothetical protein